MLSSKSGEYHSLSAAESGVSLPYDDKDMETIKLDNNKKRLLVAINDVGLQSRLLIINQKNILSLCTKSKNKSQ